MRSDAAESAALLISNIGRSDNDEDATRILDEIDVVSATVAEFFASFFVVFLGLGGVYASAIVTNDMVQTDRLLYNALCYGMVCDIAWSPFQHVAAVKRCGLVVENSHVYVRCLIWQALGGALYTFSYPTGDNRNYPNIRHMNPALTLLLTVFGNFGIGKAILYWLAQLCGTGLAVMTVYYCTPFSTRDVTSSYPQLENVSGLNEWMMELATSFTFFVTILMTSFHHWRDASKQPSVLSPLAENSPFTNHEINCVIAAAITFACALVGGPVSGGYMNPLFALGIGILSDVYKVSAFMGPIIAVVLAMFVSFAFGYNVTPPTREKSR